MKGFNISEDATPISVEEAKGLLLTHISTLKELNHWEQINIVKAIVWLDEIKTRDILNDLFIKQLHKKMFGDVWRWAGKFRQTDKNLGVPWYQISSQLRNLYDDISVWLNSDTSSPDEMAVMFHHRLVWIHPFPNGNGRHARLMTDLFLENILGLRRFSWGGNMLSEPSAIRKEYITALHSADGGDFSRLLQFARS